MPAPSTRYDADTHTYWIDGVRVPGVSELMAPIVDLSSIPEGVLAKAAARGTAFHGLSELIDADLHDMDEIDPELRGYAEAYIRFLAEHEVVWKVSEVPLFHPGRRYGGTPDRYGKVDGVTSLVDLKTVRELRPSTGVQLTAYAMLLEENGNAAPKRRLALQLKPDGTYVLKEYGDETAIFLSLLNIHHWRQRNG